MMVVTVIAVGLMQVQFFLEHGAWLALFGNSCWPKTEKLQLNPTDRHLCRLCS
jgi:hypothetical protein